MTELFDLAIVGAGPAGSAAALAALAARPDLRVALVERAQMPRDKACGDAVAPVGVDLLERLGVGDVLDGAARIDRLRIAAPDGATVAGRSRRAGYVLPRQVLDARLAAAAVARGATLVTMRVTEVEQRDGYVTLNGELAGRTVIGADGANSVVRRQVGAGTQPRRHNAVALRAYAASDGAPDQLSFRFPADPWPAYAWSFPTGAGRANVGFGVFDGRATTSRTALLDAIATLVPDAQVDQATARAHHLPLSTARPRPVHGRVLLAGDAAALVNPITGEGISTALLSGALAGRCAALRPDTAGRVYAAALAARLRRHLRHTRFAARMLERRALASAAVTAADRSARVLDDLVELALGTGPITLRMALAGIRAHLNEL